MRNSIRSLAGLALLTAVATSACAAGQVAHTAEQVATVDGTQGQVGAVELDAVKLAFPEKDDDGSFRYEEGATARLQLALANSGTGDDALVEVTTDAADEVRFLPAGEAVEEVTPTTTIPPESEEPSTAPTETPGGTSTPTETPGGTTTPTETPGGTATPTTEATGSESTEATATPTLTESTEPAADLDAIDLPARQQVTAYGEDDVQVMLIGLTRALWSGENIQVTFTFERAGAITLTVPVGISLTPHPAPVPTENEAEEH